MPFVVPAGNRQGMYSPIINAPNAWVSLDTCGFFTDNERYPPIWGLTDTNMNAADLTGIVVCCDENPNRIKTIQKTEPLDDEQQYFLDVFKPTWFGRDEGYLGTSYDDAKEFCNNVAGLELCPLEV